MIYTIAAVTVRLKSNSKNVTVSSEIAVGEFAGGCGRERLHMSRRSSERRLRLSVRTEVGRLAMIDV